MGDPVAHCYIDGFNLYYGALKGHGELKWLDVRRWCERLLPDHEVARVVYCTARIERRPDNSEVHERQGRYLLALAATGVEIIEGKFRTRVSSMVRAAGQTCGSCDLSTATCPRCGSTQIRVMKTEEKGSDVNLAVELVRDVLSSEMSTALVVSGDSDLQRAVDIVRTQGLTAVTVEPRNRSHTALIGTQRRSVRRAALLGCQMPDGVELRNGQVVRRPSEWA